MATNKKVTRVDGGDVYSTDSQKKSGEIFTPTPENKGKATQFRIIGCILWFLAIVAQISAIFFIKTKIDNMMLWVIICILVDLALVIIGSIFWKKANRLDPPSEKNKFSFFVKSQTGLIMAVVAFLPLVIFIFTSKNLDGKQKGILGAIATIALVVAGITGYDFNPASIEQYTEQTNRVKELNEGVNLVYWTKYGKVYHIYDDCPYINKTKTVEILKGTVAQARELKNITDLCKICENRAANGKIIDQNILNSKNDNVDLGEDLNKEDEKKQLDDNNVSADKENQKKEKKNKKPRKKKAKEAA